MTKLKEKKIEKVKNPKVGVVSEGVILKAVKDTTPVKIKEEKVEAPKVEAPKVEVAKIVIAADPKSMTFEEKVKINENFQDQKRAVKAEMEAKKKDNAVDELIVLEAKLKAIQEEEHKWLMSIAKMLEPEIKKNGFIYKLFKRGEKALIYAQYDKRDAEDGGGISETPIAYEVFLSKISPPKIAFKKPYEAYEMFPGNGVFGIWAWSCMTAEKVEVRFANLEKGLTAIEESEDGEGDDE